MTTAKVDDRRGALDAINRRGSILDYVKSVLGGDGYTAQAFAHVVDHRLKVTVPIAQRPQTSRFEAIPQRWVVEPSFAWLDKCRRLWKNCERYLNTSLQFLNRRILR